MRGRKREEDLKIDKIVVHVTLKEKKLIEAMAEKRGMEVAPYVRAICIYDKWNQMFGGQ